VKLEGKSVLVTGAGGFIGSHLAEALVRRGCRVRAMVRYNSRSDRGNLDYVDPRVIAEIEIVSGDVNDPHFMVSAVQNCDAVFHLAALIAIPHSYTSPASYVATNVMGTLNTMQACLRHDVDRVVHTSTSECYGTARYTPIDEDHPLQGQSPYSASKIAADKIVESFHLSFGLPVVTLRPFNTFGPRQSARAVIPTILSQLLSGASTLRLGSLTPERDFNFVSNTVDGFLAAAEADAAVGEFVNVGYGSKTSIGRLAELAMEVVSVDIPIETDEQRLRPEKSEVGLLLCDATKAGEMLGWAPRVSLREGLEQTSDFVRSHADTYRPEEYTT
jgi:NAD dependent epimerase/dehydratase